MRTSFPAFTLGLTLLAALALAACGDDGDETNDDNVATETLKIRVANASASAPAVDVYAEGVATPLISDLAYGQWTLLIRRHIWDYRAPMVFHPILLKEFYPYLDDDASGHYQVGRGYAKRGKKPDQLGYFEPWNQQRFDPSEPYIDRVQWRDAYRSYRGNQAHYAHNVGV